MSIATGAMSAAELQRLTNVTAFSKLFLGAGSAFAQLSQGKYEKGVADANSRFLERQADDAISKGETEARRHESATRGLIGRQRAAAAANGVDINSGSALDAQESAAGMGAIDALTIRNNAYAEAFGYRMGALNQKNAGKYGMRASRFVAGQTLLGSALEGYREYREGKYIAAKYGS